MLFRYTGTTAQGEAVDGIVDGVSKKHALFTLRRRGVNVADLVSYKTGRGLSRPLGWKDLAALNFFLLTAHKNGVPYDKALDSFAKDAENRRVRGLLSRTADSIRQGGGLEAAAALYPDFFVPVYLGLARGTKDIGDSLATLHKFCVRMHETRWPLGSHLVPPVFVVVLISMLAMYVVPQFGDIFGEMGASLPVPTKIILFVSELMRGVFVPQVALFIALGYLAWMLYYRGRSPHDLLLLRLPVVGKIIEALRLERLCRALAMLLESGMGDAEALHLASRVTGSPVVQRDGEKAMSLAASGHSLGTALVATGRFRAGLGWTLSRAQDPAAARRGLSRLAQTCEALATRGAPQAAVMIEALSIMLLGVGVGGTVVALFMPIMNLSSVVNN